MSESVRIVDPQTGEPLLAGASLENCYMVIAHQIFEYEIPRTGTQHTPFLKEPFVLDAQSHKLSFHLFTAASAGEIISAEAIGNVHGGGSAKIT